MVVTSSGDGDKGPTLSLFRQTTGGFAEPVFIAHDQVFTEAVSVLDLDGQHGLDVVLGGSNLAVYFSTFTGGLSQGPPVASSPILSMVPFDQNQDGQTDLATIAEDGQLFMGAPSATLPSVIWNSSIKAYQGIAAGDLDGDGRLDLAVPRFANSPVVSIYRNDSTAGLVAQQSLVVDCDGRKAVGVGIGDLNGDGIADIAVSAGGNQPNACMLVYYGKGGGVFSSAVRLPTLDIPVGLRVADLDNNGFSDIIVIHQAWQNIGVYFQTGQSGLQPETLIPIAELQARSHHALEIADLNGDGCNDIAIAEHSWGFVMLEGRNCGGSLLYADFE